MGPVAVALDTPGLDKDLGLGQRAELLVEQFVADPAVERLDVRVLPRRAGFDVDGCPHRSGGTGLATPRRSARARCPSADAAVHLLRGELLEDGDDGVGVGPATEMHGEGLSASRISVSAISCPGRALTKRSL